jgi:hypothetical protein
LNYDDLQANRLKIDNSNHGPRPFLLYTNAECNHFYKRRSYEEDHWEEQVGAAVNLGVGAKIVLPIANFTNAAATQFAKLAQSVLPIEVVVLFAEIGRESTGYDQPSGSIVHL